ncbi:hypothetical protein TrVE_jg1657 [Triparma verrucosa]|uniref:FPL domain-containing protein n=1 Tax=Triparma verrucosa TaxID=1606542 RepID=A0A9W7FMR4_9STRA|nr:hypothetical protein TrVE_jg1657 [Triparma verrucosa]
MLTELRQTYSTIIDNLTFLRSLPPPSPPSRLKMKPSTLSTFVESLRRITELVLYGDLHDPPPLETSTPSIFDYFCEKNTLTLLVDLLTGRAISEDKNVLPPLNVSLQILQTITILMQNVKRPTNLFYLLSNGYIEELMDFECGGIEEEYVVFLKVLGMRFNRETVKFFVREEGEKVKFKLCERVVGFLEGESYVRLTCYSILLNVLKISVEPQDKVLVERFISSDENVIRIVNPVITNLVKVSSKIRERILDNYEEPDASQASVSTLGELQDEIILLDDILKIEKIRKFMIEIVLGGYIYPVLLEPLLICVRHEGRRETKELGRSGFLDEQDDEDKDDEARTKWRRLCPARTSLICLTLFFNNVTSKPLLRLLASALFHPSSPSSKTSQPTDSDDEASNPPTPVKSQKNDEDGKYILAPNLRAILDGDLTDTKPNPYRRVILSSLRRGSSHAVSLQSAASGCVEGCVVRIKEMEGLREVCGLGVRGKKMDGMFLEEEGGGSLFEEVDVRGERSFSGVSDNLGEIDSEITPPPTPPSSKDGMLEDLTETINSLASSLITTPYTTSDGIKLMAYNFGTANGLCLVCKGRWEDGRKCVEGYRTRIWTYFEGVLEGDEDIWESFSGLNPKQVFAKDSTSNTAAGFKLRCDPMTPNAGTATNEECMREAAKVLLRVSALINFMKRGEDGDVADVMFSSGMEGALGLREGGVEEEEMSSDRIMELEGMTACPCVVKIEGEVEVNLDVKLEEEAGVVSEDGSRWQSLFLVIYEEEGEGCSDVRILFAEPNVGAKGKVVSSCRNLKFLRLREGVEDGEKAGEEEKEHPSRKFKFNLEWTCEAGDRPKLFGDKGLDVYFETEQAFKMCYEDVRGRIEKAHVRAGGEIRKCMTEFTEF